MIIVRPSYNIISKADYIEALRIIEMAARTCYKSEDKITEDSAAKFLKSIIKSEHDSVIEHFLITVKIICDRGISHELVRHRLSSFSQESTRYANYSKDKFNNQVTFIRPFFFKKNSEKAMRWAAAMYTCEKEYLKLLKLGAKPEEARSVLPNSLKTEITMSANIRQWRLIFKQRCSKASHPQMREIMIPMFNEFSEKMPVFFSDMKG